MTRRLRYRALAAACAAAATGLALLPAPAAVADSPSDVGWWSRVQTPAPPPGVAPPPTIPAPPPPIVPEGGLVVAMGPYSEVPNPEQPPTSPFAPVAIAALRFSVDEGASGTLSLALADGYDADGPNQQNHPPFLVDACVPDSTALPWDAPAGGANGRWEDRPVADCSSFSVPAEIGEDGTRLTWELPAQFQYPEGFFDVILVPRGIPDPQDPAKVVGAPFVLVFEAPDDQALVTEGGFSEDEGEFGGDFGDLSGDDFFGDDSFAVDDFGFAGEFGASDFGGFEASGSGVTGGGGRRPNRFQPAVGVPAVDDRVERVLAVSILLALAVGMWWIGGQPVRPPRLLGSLGSGASAPVATGIRAGGVGRFTRPRRGSPPRLS